MQLRPLCVLLCLAASAPAQTLAPPTLAAALEDMASRAGVVFAGTVESVTRMDAAGYVDVRFHIDEPVRGCKPGVYVLREWAGLWTSAPRYAPGQRRLMLLLPRGPSGMSSPVDGMAGAIPLVGGGAPAVMKDGIVPPDNAPGANAFNVDLRWVAAHVSRPSAAAAGSHGVHPGSLLPAGGSAAWTAAAPLASASSNTLGYREAIHLLRSAGVFDATR